MTQTRTARDTEMLLDELLEGGDSRNRKFKRPFSSNPKVAKLSPGGAQQSLPSEMRAFNLCVGSDRPLCPGLGDPIGNFHKLW